MCYNVEKSREDTEMDIQIRKIGMEEVHKYLEFLHEVKAMMEQDEWFFLDPDEEVYEMMERDAMGIWLAEDGARIAAVFCVVYPGMEKFNLGYDLNFGEEDLNRVVHMDTAAVHPDYRGQGLQQRMMLHAEQELEGRILMCTIHPDNRYSLNNVLKQGYSIEKKTEKYGSIRYILRKDI